MAIFGRHLGVSFPKGDLGSSILSRSASESMVWCWWSYVCPWMRGCAFQWSSRWCSMASSKQPPFSNSAPCVLKSHVDRDRSACTPYYRWPCILTFLRDSSKWSPLNNLNCCGVMSPPGVDAQMSLEARLSSWYSSGCVSWGGSFTILG